MEHIDIKKKTELFYAKIENTFFSFFSFLSTTEGKTELRNQKIRRNFLSKTSRKGTRGKSKSGNAAR
jgi:hypothetical protein